MAVGDELRQVFAATRFLSRLPIPAPEGREPDLAAVLRAAPLAGLFVAAGPALVLVLAAHVGLPSLVDAVLAILALILVTGGLHEDGLADVADGFGGGATVSRKLAIMRDSRVGAFGALALAACLLLRVAALQGLVDRAGPEAAALAMMAAAMASRGLMLLPLALLPPARSDGLARTAVTGEHDALSAVALAIALGGAALLAAATVHDRLLLVAVLVFAGAAALGTTRLAKRHLRGVTGDVVGATQQVAEMAVLLGLCAAA